MDKVTRSEAEWKKLLTRDEYRVLRQAHTEKPFTGKYNDFAEEGIYECAGCGNFTACQAACPLYWRYAGTAEICGPKTIRAAAV